MGSEGRGSAAVDGGDNDGDGRGAVTCTEDEDVNWDDAAEGIPRSGTRSRTHYRRATIA